MDPQMFGTVAQWVGIAVMLIVQSFAFYKWIDAKIAAIYQRIEQERHEGAAQRMNIRSEALAQAAKAEAVGSRSSTEVARLELKIAHEYLAKTDFEKALDRYFNPLFVRLGNLETKWERFVDSKLKS